MFARSSFLYGLAGSKNPFWVLTKSSDQDVIDNGTDTKITWDGILASSGVTVDLTNNRVTMQRAGQYTTGAILSGEFDSGGNDDKGKIYKNTVSDLIYRVSGANPDASELTQFSFGVDDYALAVGDIVEIYVNLANQTGAKDIKASGVTNESSDSVFFGFWTGP